MKVILTRDVKGMGRAHEVVTAADGHALNYLIPKKFAVAATSGALKSAEQHRKKAEERTALEARLLEQNIASLSEARIVVKAKANEKGHLYDAVGEAEIQRATLEQAKVEIPDGIIRLEKPIKELGTYAVPLARGNLFGNFSIIIEAE